jgi:hypothetical protein
MNRPAQPAASSGSPVPLALPVEPVAGESLIGLVARATRLNVLGRTSIILDQCGIRLLHPGTIGQDLPGPALLSTQLGCSEEAILARMHPYVDQDSGSLDIKWGSGALLRSDLILERRLVSPKALKQSEHHRAAWANRLLPYCQESLELLVDTCAACGRQQGWRHAWGIGHCDEKSCQKPLVHLTSEQLPSSLVEGYRLFAALASVVPSERDLEVAKLHPALQALPAAVLINFALQIGALLQEQPVRLHRTAISNLLPGELASIASSGANQLADWPNHFRATVAEQLAEAGPTSGKRHRTILNGLRRLASRAARPEQVALLRQALPEAFEHAAVALSALVVPAVGANVVCRTANLRTSELKAIREAGLIKHRVIVAGKRMQVQYDKSDTEDLARRHREAVFASRLEQKFGLPRYASEQLACLGIVQREAHPALALIHPCLRLTAASIDNLLQRLEAAARQDLGPDLMPLGTAIRIMGGKPKPWGNIFLALVDGTLPFELHGTGKFVRRAQVRLNDIKPFAPVYFEQSDWSGFPFEQTFTQIDAAEVLNLDALQIRRVIASGELTFSPQGVAVITPRAPVLELAKVYMATAEIALRTGTPFIRVPHLMAEHPSIMRHPAGWARDDFERLLGFQQ